MKKAKERIIKSILLVIIVSLYVFLVVKEAFYSVDHFLTDGLYSNLGTASRKIILVSVEDSTLKEYGSFTAFSREKTAELIDFLSSDAENAPAVIGVDIMFDTKGDAEDDTHLVEAVRKAGNVVMASSNVYRATVKVDENGTRYVDNNNIVAVNEPFDELKEVSSYGFTNANISKDGVIRTVRLYDDFDGQTVYSFDWAIMQKYAAFEADVKAGEEYSKGFYYTGRPGEYQHYALERVLNGEIPTTQFKDAIVLVGAYASGMGDAYVTAADRSVAMYGVEIHANILQAMLEDRTYEMPNLWIYALISVLVGLLIFLVCDEMHLIPATIAQLASAGLHIAMGVMLSHKGLTIPQFYYLLMAAVAVIYLVAEKYFVESYKKKKVLDSFKKYVAPQVVDGLSQNEDFETKLGGQKKDIAVLFVDIRGFTPLSESLEPEQVVGILDEYLALTTKCIFKNNGTLDKFIGDATMAMFNAPFDLEDYEMWAIKTALDIRAGGESLSEVLYERYGKKVHFGIGVNCGDAVVGNIGCDIRMDYTAIGDTVNTAARLESKAQPDEILISPKLYERVKERIIAEQVGEMALKGKAEAMLVYRVTGLKEEEGDKDE